jgi:hypothetical protein
MSFNNLCNAKKMIKNIYDFNQVKKFQKLTYEKYDKNNLITNCNLNSIDLFIYEENTIYNYLNIPNEDYRSKLENLFIE